MAQGLLHMNECRGTFYESWGMQNVYQSHTFHPFNFQKDKMGSGSISVHCVMQRYTTTTIYQTISVIPQFRN
jgi:hypothetical protein